MRWTPANQRNVIPRGGHVSRRRFLELAAAAGAGAVAAPLLGIAGRPDHAAADLPPDYVPTYPDGVICGDPFPSGAVIGTRVSPPAGPVVPVPVLWEVSPDDTFTTIVAGGVADAVPDHDHSITVLVEGLDPHSWYHYRFTVNGVSSPTGRLRTAPAPGSSPDRLVLAWASCQQRNDSLYVAHRAIAEEPGLDFWMHLGDYIYVNDFATLSLTDYRERYHLFKTNPFLQQLQATVPTVAMFDDGEFYNGVDKTGDPTRHANALKSWFENFPVIPPDTDPTRAYRQFAWGDLVDVFMIDVRQYRDPAVDATDTRTPDGSVIFDPSRTTLGATQKAWLKEAMAASNAAWKVIGNPYNMGMWRLNDLDEPWPRPAGVHPNEGIYAPNEAWDDYWAERKELLELIRDSQISNVVSLSGHTHIWLADVLQPDPDDPSSPVVAYDFTCGSLTADPDLLLGGSGSPAETYAFYSTVHQAVRGTNPWKAYVNFINQGYGLATIEPDRMVIEFKAINVYSADAEPEVIARFTIETCAPTMRTEVWPAPNYHVSPPIHATGDPEVFELPGAGAFLAACAPDQPADPGGDPGEDPGATATTTTGGAQGGSGERSEARPRFTG